MVAATPPPSRRQAAHAERRAVGPLSAAATPSARPSAGAPSGTSAAAASVVAASVAAAASAAAASAAAAAAETPGGVSDGHAPSPPPVTGARTPEVLPPRARSPFVHTKETRRKIGEAMTGQSRTAAVREKVSAALRGRIPWNKGKKMSPETRARMSEARTGSSPWNRGRRLSSEHRLALSRSLVEALAGGRRTLTSPYRLQMIAAAARARPRSDGIVRGMARMSRARRLQRLGAGGARGGRAGAKNAGGYPLVSTADIHEFVSLRRQLRVWSDAYTERNGRRPSLSDVRRLAPLPVVRKFESYMETRQLLRGLAADVVGGAAVAASKAAIAAGGKAQSVRRPDGTLEAVDGGKGNGRSGGINTQQQAVVTSSFSGTPYGMGVVGGATAARSTIGYASIGSLARYHSFVVAGDETAHDDLGVGLGRSDYSSGFLSAYSSSSSLSSPSDVAAVPSRSSPTEDAPLRQLSADDYRLIGKHRLMTTGDIHSYIQLRRRLKAWSDTWKASHHTSQPPTLSDVREDAPPSVYAQFCEYISLRGRMRGLAKEVFGAEVDDMEGMQRTANAGKSILHALKAGAQLSEGTRRGGAAVVEE